LVLEVAIPDTSLIDCTDLRQKSVKVGNIGRAFAVFRVERVYIYKTNHLPQNQRRDVDLLFRLLQYLDTPQYLRRRVFPHVPSLKFVGLLPPLRTRSHPLQASVEDIEEGDIRWGIQVRNGSVDIGTKQLIKYPGMLSEREPSLFRIVQTKPEITLEIIQRDDTDEYWGFETQHTENLVQALRRAADKTRIAFSRIAPIYSKIENELINTISATRSVCAVFGGPRHGVRELLTDEMDALKESVDFWINTVAGQGTETVRLEEAIWTSLSLLNNSVGSVITKSGFY
jgi:predicted SPOUT superfamily RNA methylase MTH1